VRLPVGGPYDKWFNSDGTPTAFGYERLKLLDAIDSYDPTSLTALVNTKSAITRTINNQSGTTYTFALSDAGNYVSFNNASPITVTVPTNASVAFPLGTQIDFASYGNGKVTFVGAGGVTIFSLNNNKSLAAVYAAGTLLQIYANQWLLTGSLTA